MKQKSSNTFNKGLNFDLNPITTPNDILTDCVNGTFITFNGDELALQNDAGNTIILDNEGDPIRLSDGYYPIGIKEFGGVLYIVSSNLSMAKPFVLGNDYLIGDIVYENDVYYKSLENDSHIELSDNGYWEEIGSKQDFIDQYVKVEFGSYPSPNETRSTEFKIGPDILLNTINTESKIYATKEFKSGSFVTFDNIDLDDDLTYVSGYDDSFNYVSKFYKVKLYQKIKNGFIDLTESIWKKYKEYCDSIPKSIINRFWFNDSEFKYMPDDNYISDLYVAVEVEEINTFKLDKSWISVYYSDPEIEEAIPYYSVNLNLSVIGNNEIDIESVSINLKVDGLLDETFISPVVSNKVEFNSYIDESLLLENDTYKFKKLTYTVTPIYKHEGSDITDDLTDVYKSNYNITGFKELVIEPVLINIQTNPPVKTYLEASVGPAYLNVFEGFPGINVEVPTNIELTYNLYVSGYLTISKTDTFIKREYRTSALIADVNLTQPTGGHWNLSWVPLEESIPSIGFEVIQDIPGDYRMNYGTLSWNGTYYEDTLDGGSPDNIYDATSVDITGGIPVTQEDVDTYDNLDLNEHVKFLNPVDGNYIYFQKNYLV